MRMRISLTALMVLALGSFIACAHPSPKVVIDVADRTAYQALRAFDTAEETAYHAKGIWPTAAQHQAISAKFSEAYQAVVDVASLGASLPAGAKLSAADLAVVGKLTVIVDDLAKLLGQPGVGTDVAAKFAAFQTKAAALVASIGGK